MLMRLEQMKNKNYLRQKINYNNSTEVMGEGGGEELFRCVQVEAKLQEITRMMIIVDLSLLRSADSQMRPWLLHVPS